MFMYIIYIHICIWSKMELQSFSHRFLKIKQKEAQINLISKDKSSETHTGESIFKISDCDKQLGIKIDLKRHFN